LYTGIEMSSPRNYAVILGVSSGFGKATALALAKLGYHIFGVHLDRAAGMAAVDELRDSLHALGVDTHFFNVNAADADRRTEIVESLKTEMAKYPGSTVKVLLHSLAFGSLLPLVGDKDTKVCSQKQLEMTMDVMANSIIYWSQAIMASGLFSKGSRIIGLTSAGSQRVLPMYGAVAAAKSAMESYIRQMALELAPHGITANSIRAGVTYTPALDKIPGSDTIMKNAYMRNPYHRLTQPEDIANVISLLVKPECDWINGTILGVDGGEDSIDLTWWTPEEQA
jgi:NAD(P)-dependent dehydrogenase (short-subunit alcohol dehydrogenase family)